MLSCLCLFVVIHGKIVAANDDLSAGAVSSGARCVGTAFVLPVAANFVLHPIVVTAVVARFTYSR